VTSSAVGAFDPGPDGWVRTLLVLNGVVAGTLAVLPAARSASDRRTAYGALEPASRRDPLTGLDDRRGLLSEIGTWLDATPAQRPAVLFVDLDGLKWINDSRGHAAGDQILISVAHRMRAAARPTDLLARLGGDEFVVGLRGVRDAGEALAVAERLLAALAEPVHVPGAGELFPRASIGVAVAEATSTAEGLLLDADAAMYRAKAEGGSQVSLFNPVMQAAARRRHAVEHALHSALRDRQLDLHFQPIVTTGEQRIVGFEALARWRHDQLGVVSPTEFVPAAETSGLIHDLGAELLVRALSEAVTWPPAPDGTDYTLAINVSWLQLARGGFPGLLAEALNTSGVDPSRICVEVTETALSDAVDAVAAALLLVQTMGVSVAIDDFGTGHASVRYLTQLPIDVVKIDRSFVVGVGADDRADGIVAGIVAMARSRSLTVIAEGVEVPRQLAALERFGVPLAQGYLLGRPLPAPQLSRLIGAPVPALRLVPTPVVHPVIHPVIPRQRP
jgi:diguanylate cyclase (GGDEF)-like protein